MRTVRRLALAALLIGAGALPLLVGDYRTFQLTLALIYAIAILGLNILTGYNGQVSLGHGAFYALGAYTAAILMTQAGVDYYWTLPIAGAIGFGAGFLFGFPALRLRGLYLALATFALASTGSAGLRFDSGGVTRRRAPASPTGSGSTAHPAPSSAYRLASPFSCS